MYESIIRSLGSVFDNRKLYGVSHKVTVRSLENAFEAFSQFLSKEHELIFTVSPDDLHINHQIVEAKNALMLGVVDMFRTHEISTMTILKDLSPDEFLRLVDLIAQEPEAVAVSGGIASLLNNDDFPHIGSRNVKYVELSEEEVVVRKDDVAVGSDHNESDALVMDYLTGESDGLLYSPGSAVVDGFQELIDKPAELGKIIVQSAASSSDVDIVSDKSLSANAVKDLIDGIVESLNKTFDILKNDKSNHSQKGKKRLSKYLKILEGDLEKFIKDTISTIEDKNLNPICCAVDAMTDELEIDALATEYLRKRKLIEVSENHLIKYIEHHDHNNDDELKSKLLEGGLSPHSWEMLMVASGKSKSIGEKWIQNTKLPEFKPLQDKLIQLSRIFCNVDPEHATTPEQLQKVISQVEEHLEKLIKNTERRIRVILKRIIADENSSESRETESSKKLTRHQLLELIAEIVQELYQPLSVVQCVLQSTLSKRSDMNSAEQIEFLELANRSAQRLTALISELYTVVGNPSTLSPAKQH